MASLSSPLDLHEATGQTVLCQNFRCPVGGGPCLSGALRLAELCVNEPTDIVQLNMLVGFAFLISMVEFRKAFNFFLHFQKCYCVEINDI